MMIAPRRISICLRLLAVAVLLYLFLVSIGLMGAAFKGMGKDFATKLIETTSNPFVGLFIGVLATGLVQSSSTVTSLIVGIVGAGGLTVEGAVPMIMGANIGTTVTNTLVSLGHVSRREEFRRAIGAATVHDFFNVICVLVLFPIELATGYLQKAAEWLASCFVGTQAATFDSPVKLIVKPTVQLVERLLTSLTGSEGATHGCMAFLSMVILFFALYFIVKVMKSLVMNRAEIVMDNVLNRNAWFAFLAGVVFTTVVQSSSITTSLMIPLVASGILTVEGVFPITIGANIGTTTTAILASLATGNVHAIVIAFSHFLFNLTGTVLIYPIPLCRRIPIKLAKSFGDLAAEKRWLAFAYVLGMFFGVPGVLVFVSNRFF